MATILLLFVFSIMPMVIHETLRLRKGKGVQMWWMTLELNRVGVSQTSPRKPHRKIRIGVAAVFQPIASRDAAMRPSCVRIVLADK